MSEIAVKRDIRFLVGKDIPADNGNPIDKKPVWFDKNKYSRVKEILKQNFSCIFLSHLSGLILIFLYTPLVEPFLYTGESSSIPAIRRRYLNTCKHVIGWYMGDIWDSDNLAHKSIVIVRGMHKKVAEAMDSENSGVKAPEEMLFFSQSGMAFTQFAFIGLLICYPEDSGFYCDKEDMECLLHFWRCIGYLLGMDDNYNICDGNYEESVALFKQIIEKEIKVRLKNPRKEGLEMSRNIVTALSKMFPLLSWPALKKYWFEIIDFPVDFSLSFYDTVCYWYYKFFVKVFLKYKFFRWLTNKAIVYLGKKVLLSV